MTMIKKLGVSVATFDTNFGPIVYSSSDLSTLNGIFKKIKDIGYSCVDLFIDQISEEKAKSIKEILDQNDLKVSMLVCIYLAGLGVNFGSKDEVVRKKSVQTYVDQMTIARILDAPTMPVGFIRGRLNEDDHLNDYYKRLSESLKTLVKEAKKQSVELCLEPINRYEVNTIFTLDEAVEFIETYELNGLKILADFFHMNIEDKDMEESLRRAKGKIRHVHIADSNRRAPGMGHLDYASLLSTLESIGFEGYLVSEAMPFGEPDECAKTGYDYIKKTLNLKKK